MDDLRTKVFYEVGDILINHCKEHNNAGIGLDFAVTFILFILDTAVEQQDWESVLMIINAVARLFEKTNEIDVPILGK